MEDEHSLSHSYRNMSFMAMNIEIVYIHTHARERELCSHDIKNCDC